MRKHDNAKGYLLKTSNIVCEMLLITILCLYITYIMHMHILMCLCILCRSKLYTRPRAIKYVNKQTLYRLQPVVTSSWSSYNTKKIYNPTDVCANITYNFGCCLLAKNTPSIQLYIYTYNHRTRIKSLYLDIWVYTPHTHTFLWASV